VKNRTLKSISALLLVMMIIQMIPTQAIAMGDAYADSGALGSFAVQEGMATPKDGELPEGGELPPGNELPKPTETIPGIGEIPVPSGTGVSSEKHELIWIDPGNSAVTVGGNSYEITPESNANQTVTVQLNFTLGGKDSVPVGAVKIRIPKHILENRDGNGAILQVDLGVPKAPAMGDTNFNYTEDGDYFVLTNYRQLMPADNLTCTVSYQFRPSDIQNGKTFSFQAQFQVEDENDTPILDTASEELDMTVHTSAELYSLSKTVIGKWESWQTGWGTAPADAGDYFYVAYYYSCPLNIGGNTQPYTIRFEEDPKGDSELAGWWAPLDTTNKQYTQDLLKTSLINVSTYPFTPGTAQDFHANASYKVQSPIISASGWGRILYQAVLVKYPRTSLSGETSVTNSITAKLYGRDNGNSAPLDTKTASIAYDYTNVTHQYPGDLYSFEKGLKSASHPGALNMLLADRPVQDRWSMKANARSWDLTNNGTKDYTLELEDMGMSGGLVPLEDYVFTSFFPYQYFKYDHTIDENKGYVEVESKDYSTYEPLKIYIQTGADVASETWTHFGTFKMGVPSEFTYTAQYGGTTLTGLNYNSNISLPAETGRIKAGYTGNAYKVYLIFYVTTELQPTQKVKVLAQSHFDSNGKWMVTNYASLRVEDAQGSQKEKRTTSRNLYLTGLETTSQLEKRGGLIQNDPTHSRMTQDFTVEQYDRMFRYSTSFTIEELLEKKLFKPQQTATFYDLLPKGAKVKPDSVAVGTYLYGNSNMTGSSAAHFTVTYEENWRDSGQTMMIVKVTGRTDRNPNVVYSTSDPTSLCTGYTLTYTVYYPWEDIACYGSKMLNSVAYHAEEGHEFAKGSADDGDFGYNAKTDKVMFEDLDAENANNRTEKRFLYAEYFVTLNPVTAHESGLLKKVIGSDVNAGYGNSAQIDHDDSYTYRLRFVSQTGQSSSGVILYDGLEVGGPKGQGDWRGVLKSIDISHPLSKGIDVKVYYSEYPNGIDPTNPAQANLSDTTYWTSTKPNDLSKVTALAFDLTSKKAGDNYVFAPGEGVEIFLHMKAPADSSTTGAAYNTAYLKATITPTEGNPSTATEPGNTTEVRLASAQRPGPDTGCLKICKTVTGSGADTNKEFEFTVTLLDRNNRPLTDYYDYTGNTGKTGIVTSGDRFSLRHNESVTITGLPAETEFKVVEDDYIQEDYIPFKDTIEGFIKKNNMECASFENTKVQSLLPQSGLLEIRKTVMGNGGDLNKEFEFTVDFEDTTGRPLVGTYDYSNITGSKSGTLISGGTISLKHGEVVTVQGLPAGTKYTVTEADYSVDGYAKTSVGENGSITENQIAIAGFTNIKDQAAPPGPEQGPDPEPDPAPKPEPTYGKLSVRKTVLNGDTSRKFVFTITFQNASGQTLAGSYGYTGSKTGSIKSSDTFTLGHGESITIEGLPSGTKYLVAENDYSNERCKTTKTGDAGTVTANATTTAKFINRFPDVVSVPDGEIPYENLDLPRTGDHGITHWIWLLLLSAAGSCITLITERKRKASQIK